MKNHLFNIHHKIKLQLDAICQEAGDMNVEEFMQVYESLKPSMQEKNYVLIINGEKALWQHESGYMNYTITAKLSFEESEDAEYFIEHFNGQDNYHDAMADDKEVKWSIYLQGKNGEFEDKMVKRLPNSERMSLADFLKKINY